MRLRLFSACQTQTQQHHHPPPTRVWAKAIPPHCRVAHSARRLSIADRLAARSLTGRGLNIHVHQHFGYRLHLEWSGDPNNHRSARFMERRFHRWDQTKSFASQLCSLGIEGLCTCVYEASYQPPHDKAPRCLRGPFYASQKLIILPTHELKIMEDYAIFNLCDCKITSAPTER